MNAGTIIPWSTFNTETLPIWRLILSAILLLAFRRLPLILLIHKYIPALADIQQASLIGWFGPIGPGSLYYMSLAALRIPNSEPLVSIISFMVLASIIGFGITVPFAHFTIVTVSSLARSGNDTNGSNDTV